MSRRKCSSKAWARQHARDPYVRRARAEGYRSRAAYKLEDLQRRDRLLAPGMTVVDLGAAPGGWSQYAAVVVGREGRVIALDELAMEPLAGVEQVQGDFRETEVLERLRGIIGDRPVDVVISDMAPNISGIDAADQARAAELAELAAELAREVLEPGGDLLVKAFQGEGFDALLGALRGEYRTVKVRKPDASRARSREVYLLARGRKV